MDSLFGNMIFYKKEDTEDGSSIYVAKVLSQTTSGFSNYLILVCQKSNKQRGKYGDFVVQSIQSRKIQSHYFRCPDSVWSPSRDFYSIPITITERTKEHTRYATPASFQEEFGISDVMLYHDHRKKALGGGTSTHQYPNKYTLLGALETFFCIIVLSPPPDYQDSYVLL
jgi:hypothetical protein